MKKGSLGDLLNENHIASTVAFFLETFYHLLVFHLLQFWKKREKWHMNI